jgi:acyl-[acyl-carrier-protein]-phospholipid O-acyltransferase/long-chain-fatty-acid--[acyl-carrier-protein] ligase
MRAASPGATPRRRRLAGVRALLGVQCLGAFNANLYKTTVSLMAADVAVVGHSGAALLSLSSIVFVVPYLLFSGYAGYLADRFDKRSVVIVGKIAEILVMALALAALSLQSILLLVLTLFLLSSQAAVVSPAKYGLLPETLDPSNLAWANGVMETSRYLAIILGTAAAGFLLSAWRGDPGRIGIVLVGVAAAGVAGSVMIGRRPRPAGGARFQIAPWREIADGVRRLSGDRRLAFAIGGIVCFEFMCALVMLDMVLVGKTQMGLGDAQIGALGMTVGIGAGVGSVAAGILSRGRVEPGLAFAGHVGVGAMLMVLVPATASLAATMSAFLALGLFAGMVIVPLNALLQHASDSQEKGRLIATGNFLGMAGVIAASVCLWVLHDLCGISPRGILIVAGVLVLSTAPVAARWRPECTVRALWAVLDSGRLSRADRAPGTANPFDLP